MKVYVDEFPKCCLECQLECPYEDRCVDTITMNCSECIGRPKDCPLQPLADYTKQVREKVCEEIKKILLKQRQEIYKQIEDNSTDISYWTGHLDRLDVFEFEILDQLQD